MKIIQAKLEQDNKTLFAWIDQTKHLKVGNRITLKGESGWWIVKELYDTVLDHSQLHTDWNNNI